MTTDANGSYRPSFHDSSGHTWHHANGLLLTIARDSSNFPESRMPTFGNTLTDHEIDSVLEFLKPTWGPKVGKK